MATATVTKQKVERQEPDDYIVTIHVLIEAGGVKLLEKNYSARYHASLPVSVVKTNLQNQMILDWNKIKEEATVFDAAAFDTMVAEIQTTANTVINI